MTTGGIVITGPLSPADVSHLLTGGDRERAASIQGYRGVPTQTLVEAFLAMGEQVEVVTEATDVDGPVELQGKGIRLLIAPMRPRARHRALDLFRQERMWLSRLLRQTQGRVVSAQWTYEFAWAALDSGRPALVTAHDAPLTILSHYRDPYRAARTVMAYLVRLRVTNLAAVSPDLAHRWRREMMYRGRIAILPNIAPALHLSPQDRTMSTCPELVAVASSGRLKNVDCLVEAFDILRRQGRALRLNLVGSGLGATEELAARARSRGMSEGISFLGVLDRTSLADVLSRSAVFVHPSLEESFGMVLLEAMAARLPIVAGVNAGGVPWVLANGDAGRLVDVTNPHEIAAAVEDLLDDEAAAAAMTARAESHMKQVFSPGVVVEAYLSEFERMLAASSGRGRRGEAGISRS